MRSAIAPLILSLLLAVAACDKGPTFPTDIAEYGRQLSGVYPYRVRPEFYAESYAAMEKCSGLKGDLEGIDWFTAERIEHGGYTYLGYWSPHRRVYIVDGYTHYRRLVEHEMLHDLLSGDGGHLSSVWDDCDRRLVPDVPALW